jgi:TolA-binding protein
LPAAGIARRGRGKGLAALGVAVCLAAAALPFVGRQATAQVDSREAIALQNQILQLRQELDLLRRSGATAPAPARQSGTPNELVGQLLSRVAAMEEEVRRLRGRIEELDFARRQQSQAFEKLQGDIDFRLQQLEGQGGAATRPSPAAVAPPAAAAPLPAIAAPPAGPVPRTPERAIAEGQAALGRRDYLAAEAAAREALRNRGIGPRAADAQMLLGDSLAGRRDWAGAALAYNDAYSRNRGGPRAPEALVGLAGAFASLGNQREACDTLADLRNVQPNLRPPLSERAQEIRQRARCR